LGGQVTIGKGPQGSTAGSEWSDPYEVEEKKEEAH
jgi:hypothetical protein